MSNIPPAWSFSSIKLFSTCPRKYESERVTKEVGYTETDATRYGTALHLAAEEYVRDGKDLEPRFEYVRSYLDKLIAIPGEKLCEIKLGLKYEDGRLVDCDFDDPDVYFRGIADLVIMDGTIAHVIDYKTSKSARYADSRQLALMAACLFTKYPELEKVKAALLFVVSKELVKTTYHRDTAYDIFAELHGLLTQRKTAYDTGVFNPKPNGLCRNWCNTDCPHNGKL